MKSLNVNEMRSLEGGRAASFRVLDDILMRVERKAETQVNLVASVTGQKFQLRQGQFVMFSEILEFDEKEGLRFSNFTSLDGIASAKKLNSIITSLLDLNYIITGNSICLGGDFIGGGEEQY